MLRTKIMRATAAVTLAVLMSATAAPAIAMAGTVKLAGSTSLQPLAQQWAVAYHKTHPGTNVVVAGGGSGAGFSSALNGSVDIGMSSKTAADSDKTAQLTAVARDAVGIIVNPKTNVRSLTAAQVKGIFTGQYKTWKSIGGKSKSGFNANHAIVLAGRTGASGTYDFFKVAFLGGVRQSSRTKMYASSGMVRAAVARDPYAIGYVSMAYINRSVIGVGIAPRKGAKSIGATAKNVRAGKYPYSRYLYFVNYAAHPRGAEANAFVAWCLSSAGQKIANIDYLSLR